MQGSNRDSFDTLLQLVMERKTKGVKQLDKLDKVVITAMLGGVWKRKRLEMRRTATLSEDKKLRRRKLSMNLTRRTRYRFTVNVD